MRAQAAAVAAVRGKEGPGASGKAVETGVGRIGFHAGHGSLVDAVYPLLAQDLSGNLLQRFPGRGDFFENHFLAVGIRADDVVVGHHQAVAAVERVAFGKALHGKPGLAAAGANAESKGPGPLHPLCKGGHGLRYAPGIYRKDKANLLAGL